MRFSKKVSVELKGDSLEAYNCLRMVIEEQRAKGVSRSDEITLWNGIQRTFDLISQDPFYGRNVKKGQIPNYYLEKYDAGNLFVANLPLYWRMIYTLEGNKVEIVAFVLDIFSHKEYDKKFGFRKK